MFDPQAALSCIFKISICTNLCSASGTKHPARELPTDICSKKRTKCSEPVVDSFAFRDVGQAPLFPMTCIFAMCNKEY
ncbi:hypothetical protein WAI453_009815 [Rhynchosporium graminicola]